MGPVSTRLARGLFATSRNSTGDPVAVIARRGAAWCLNACKIIYVLDEREPIRRTMDWPTERCLIMRPSARSDFCGVESWGRRGVVRHFAFSRPARLLTRIGIRYMRRIQKQFGKESAAAMVARSRAEKAESDGPNSHLIAVAELAARWTRNLQK